MTEEQIREIVRDELRKAQAQIATSVRGGLLTIGKSTRSCFASSIHQAKLIRPIAESPLDQITAYTDIAGTPSPAHESRSPVVETEDTPARQS